ncbi:putative methyltransferase-domain-containing protein [Lipomyces japonicus]|uniref:putative methyltransferase-domain-containing protein n=1 Tax=Lipomyces japonicus TaxID=56871 RepID=UPI0034CF7040
MGEVLTASSFEKSLQGQATSLEDEDPFSSFLGNTDLVPPADDVTMFAGVDYATSHAGVLEVDLNGALVKIKHDGGATGCGGKVWPAGELLSKYLVSAEKNSDYVAHDLIWKQASKRKVKIIELGSGTGLVGLALGRAYNVSGNVTDDSHGLDIIVTDQENMLNLMEDNVSLNNLNKEVSAAVLDWGSELPERFNSPDIILAADCVYFEPAFPLLEKTLLDLTTPETFVLMSYKKRRRADIRFFHSIRKHFRLEEIKNYDEYPSFSRETVFLYRLIRK